jgi:hypothetical protein
MSQCINHKKMDGHGAGSPRATQNSWIAQSEIVNHLFTHDSKILLLKETNIGELQRD